jgi:hypothetical protein
MKDSIKTKDAITVLSKQLPPVLYASISGLITVNPVWSVLFITAIGLINTWSDFGQSRINELVIEIEKHKNEFDTEILNSDKFKSIFLNVIEAHIKETMTDKRKLYRNYLINVGKGIKNDFEYHSKLLTTLNLITFEEIQTLEEIHLAYARLNEDYKKLNPGQLAKPTVEEINNQLLRMGRNNSLKFLHLNMRLLQTYNLILTEDASYSGSGAASIRFEIVTEFGETFLEFISVT